MCLTWKNLTIAAFLLVATASLAVCEQTWTLDRQQNWQEVSQSGERAYLLDIAEIKKLVEDGETREVRRKIEQVQQQYPDLAEKDVDAFLKAELLLSKGKYAKAYHAYENFLNEYSRSSLYDAALQREYQIGNAYLTGRKRSFLGIFKLSGFAQGKKIMDNISDRAGSAPVAVKAAVAVAQNYEEREDYEAAYYKWSEIRSRWPQAGVAADALLAMARTKHAAYKGPQYTALNLLSAQSYYRKFKSAYPERAEKLKITEKLEQITQQRAYKKYYIGRYYQRTAKEQAANLYFQYVIDNWPDTVAAQKAKERISK